MELTSQRRLSVPLLTEGAATETLQAGAAVVVTMRKVPVLPIFVVYEIIKWLEEKRLNQMLRVSRGFLGVVDGRRLYLCMRRVVPLGILEMVMDQAKVWKSEYGALSYGGVLRQMHIFARQNGLWFMKRLVRMETESRDARALFGRMVAASVHYELSEAAIAPDEYRRLYKETIETARHWVEMGRCPDVLAQEEEITFQRLMMLTKDQIEAIDVAPGVFFIEDASDTSGKGKLEMIRFCGYLSSEMIRAIARNSKELFTMDMSMCHRCNLIYFCSSGSCRPDQMEERLLDVAKHIDRLLNGRTVMSVNQRIEFLRICLETSSREMWNRVECVCGAMELLHIIDQESKLPIIDTLLFYLDLSVDKISVLIKYSENLVETGPNFREMCQMLSAKQIEQCCSHLQFFDYIFPYFRKKEFVQLTVEQIQTIGQYSSVLHQYGTSEIKYLKLLRDDRIEERIDMIKNRKWEAHPIPQEILSYLLLDFDQIEAVSQFFSKISKCLFGDISYNSYFLSMTANQISAMNECMKALFQNNKLFIPYPIQESLLQNCQTLSSKEITSLTHSIRELDSSVDWVSLISSNTIDIIFSQTPEEIKTKANSIIKYKSLVSVNPKLIQPEMASPLDHLLLSSYQIETFLGSGFDQFPSLWYFNNLSLIRLVKKYPSTHIKRVLSSLHQRHEYFSNFEHLSFEEYNDIIQSCLAIDNTNDLNAKLDLIKSLFPLDYCSRIGSLINLTIPQIQTIHCLFETGLIKPPGEYYIQKKLSKSLQKCTALTPEQIKFRFQHFHTDLKDMINEMESTYQLLYEFKVKLLELSTPHFEAFIKYSQLLFKKNKTTTTNPQSLKSERMEIFNLFTQIPSNQVNQKLYHIFSQLNLIENDQINQTKLIIFALSSNSTEVFDWIFKNLK